MTQKPDSSQRSSQPVKVWVNLSKQNSDRLSRWRGINHRITGLFKRISPCFPSFRWGRVWRIWVVGWLLGILTALMPLASAYFTQSTSSQAFSEAIVQVRQFFDQTPPADLPRATSGLTQPPLWKHAATLAAYLGHLPYPKQDSQTLTQFPASSSTYSYAFRAGEFLHPEAATALQSMIDAARTDGVWILLVSGFRDLATQHRLFEERAAAYGSVEQAAKSVAPPGYSEHHTGYAIDVTDGSGIGFYAFEQTAAFRWMQTHAHEFGFELSFPQNNEQGIDYEPWHWRFVGSPEAAKLFAAARGIE